MNDTPNAVPELKQILDRFASLAEDRRNLVNALRDKVSFLTPITTSPSCEEKEPPNETIISQLRLHCNGIADDNNALANILSALKRLV
jgi:hypothetical protein